jgi:hypothetical protein
MPYPQELEYWSEEVSIAFPKLSHSQARVLALYSYGMAMTKRCGQTIVCVFLALLLQVKSQNLRQVFKEFLYEAEAKRGTKRRELEPEDQFADLLLWVLKQARDKKKIVLGVDVTYLKDRHTILCISLLPSQTAIPLAWKVLPGNTKGAWHPLWLQLLAELAKTMPPKCQVLLLFDRALYSKALFLVVRAYGWHPFMRIQTQGFYQVPGRDVWQKLEAVAYRGMKAKVLAVDCFKGDPLRAYLWVEWVQGQDEPCLLLTDLRPKQVKGNPYPLRMWIELGFKAWKRGAFHLEQSKTPDSARLARLIFVMTIALLHLIRLGTALVTELTLASDPMRRLSFLTRGWLHLLVASIQDKPLTEGGFQALVLPPFFSDENTYP